MFFTNRFHKDEKGQTALETAIILIAFVVVASVFAFTILSAGTASTEKGEEAIYAGLEGVQSSMQTKGAIIAESAGTAVDKVKFTVALVGGGDPVDLTSNDADDTCTSGAGTVGSDGSGTDNTVIISYRDGNEAVASVGWCVNWVVSKDGGTPDNLLEEGELAEIYVDLANTAAIATAPGVNTEFTLEVKPETGAVLNINRTTPAALETVMELR